MSLEVDLRARLLAAPAVTALVGTRVSWAVRPDTGALPCIVLTVIADNRDQHLEGFHSLWDTRVQLDCWAELHADACALRDAVIAAIWPRAIGGATRFDHAAINTVLDRGEDTPSESTPITFIHRQLIDATIWHGPAGA